MLALAFVVAGAGAGAVAPAPVPSASAAPVAAPAPAPAVGGLPKDLPPLLFCRRANYQGLHIYDTFYQFRTGGVPSGIYVLENPSDPPEKHRIRAVIDPTTPVTLGGGIYFDPALSFDATKILFCHKPRQGANSTIYEIRLDGTGLRQITNLDRMNNPYKGGHGQTGHHDVKPGYLADGRIVFTSTRYSGLVPCANNGVAILHIANADGSDIHTISVNNVTEFDPQQLPDGRILFGRWEYIDKNALTIQSLWTVNPAGTNETALFANNMVFPEAVLQAKPVPGVENLLVATFAPHNAPPRGSIALINTAAGKGKNDPSAIKNLEHPNRPTFDRGNSCDPWALSANSIVYSGKVAGKNPGPNALMHIDGAGNKTPILRDPKIDLHNPIPLVPRARPRLIADTTDRTKITGNFLVVDVYRGAEMAGVKRGSVKWLRVLEETSRVTESPGGTWMNQTFSISAALAWSPKIYHGIVPVEEDGSAFFEAPSGRALYFQLLDADYRLVRSMRTFVQAAPGSTRSCIGCHEYENAPTTPRAFARRAPKKLRDESWGGGYMDYASMVQPILDRRCAECHGGEKGYAGGLDLTGGWTEFFNNSYETLTARREKQYIADLIAGVCCMNGTADYSCKIFQPYEHGSGKAPLARLLTTGKHRTIGGLTETERQLLLAWIDSNGIYFGTWDYTPAGPRLAGYSKLVNQLKAEMKAAGCAECHGDAKGNIRRFDNWVNLERPELSLVLRAPLAKPTKGAKSAAGGADGDGFGLALCRQRKVDQNFSRRGTMFKAGYAHQVKPLDQFPTQKWVPWKDAQSGAPVVTFKDGTGNAHYQKMLALIRDARAAVLANPRVDVAGAATIGKGIVAGRSRQIIPQPLPETMPALHAEATPHGVRLSWERSARTIGLITEIHRGTTPDFTPSPATLIGSTERFEFFDAGNRGADVGNSEKARTAGATGSSRAGGVHAATHYAIVFVSDPAATCGTCKSGATLDYKHTAALAAATGTGDATGTAGDAAGAAVPERKRIEDRCPLSMVAPIRSAPSRTTFSAGTTASK